MDSVTSSSSETTRAPSKLRRKSHRKSRNGCARCKRRKIKCDEIKPRCTNCAEFGIECDYNVATPSTGNLTLTRAKFVHTQGLPAPKQSGRPRTIWGDEIPIPSSFENESLSLRRSQRFFPETQDHVDDFRLLNHFITRTIDCPDPTAPKNIRDPLHDQALLLSFTHPCILHLIQEFSALELARQQPLKQEHYRTLAEKHSTQGLQGATALLTQFTTSNYHAAYTAATFACIDYVARGPQPGEYLLFSLNGPSQWLPLLHGIRTIIDMVGIEKIAAGPAENVPQGTPAMAESPAKILLRYPDLDWSDHIARLKAFVLSSPNSAVDLDALNKLTWCYEATYGLEGVFKGDVNHQNAFIWPYQLDAEFTTRIQCGQPLSLIVAAYFALLLQNYEFTWYMVGWSDHVLTGIVQVIDQSYRGWLDWPIKHARRIRVEKESRRAVEEVDVAVSQMEIETNNRA